MPYVYLTGGILLFILGIISYFKTMHFSPSFYAMTISGFSLFLVGLKTLKKTLQESIRGTTKTRVDRMAAGRAVPMKKCPSCGGEIEVSSKICPVCGFQYQVIYTLTVFSPFDVAKREGLIKYLMTRMGRPYEEISIGLEKGMTFKYSSKEDLDKNRASFEKIGCTVKVGEILQDR